MIPNSGNMATVEGSLDAQEDIKMTIDAAATAHIMSVLTDLYSDQESACLREYSTNALDSHIEAGQTRPIEVTLPSPFSSYLKIKDFGVGMNIDNLRDTYSKYGASTKRESDDYNGTLGLGSKSALTYTHQFTVIAVKDGVKSHVAVSRVEDGSAVMQVVDTVSTDEPNGVEVSIPVKQNNNFADKARNFFRFWKPGTVLLNGEDPTIPLTKITDQVYTFEGSNSDNYIVMANVPYPVSRPLDGGLHGWNRKFGIVAFVETGAVHFTPSREGLIYTPVTTNVINALVHDYKEAIGETIREDIEAADTAGEAFKRYQKWINSLGSSFMQKYGAWRGQKIPIGYIPAPKSSNSYYLQGITWSINQARYAVNSRSNLEYTSLVSNLVILNYKYNGTISYTNKQKIKAYLKDKNYSYNRVILLNDPAVPGAPWTDEAVTVEWEEIAAIRLNQPNRGGGTGTSYAGGYDIWDTDGIKIRHDLKPTDTVVYYTNTDYRHGRYNTNLIGRKQYDTLTSLMPGVRLVQVSRNRQDKLRRLYPKAKELRQALTDLVSPVQNALSWEDRVRLTNYDWRVSRWKHHIHLADQIDDPDVKKWLRALTDSPSPEQQKFSNLTDIIASIAGSNPVAFEPVPSPLGEYVLADPDRPEHSVIYINAVYAARKDSK